MHFLKEGQKIRAWVDPPPLFGQCPKENVFFIEAFPYYHHFVVYVVVKCHLNNCLFLARITRSLKMHIYNIRWLAKLNFKVTSSLNIIMATMI